MSEIFNRIPAEQLIIKELASAKIVATAAAATSAPNSNVIWKGLLAIAGGALIGLAVYKIMEVLDKDKDRLG